MSRNILFFNIRNKGFSSMVDDKMFLSLNLHVEFFVELSISDIFQT